MRGFHVLRISAALAVAVASGAAAAELPLAKLKLRGMSAGWGRPAADRSVDSNPLRIGGVAYSSGVGTHATSELAVRLNGATRFRSAVGVDDETGGKGSVEFRVLGDGKPLWSSGVMKGGDAAKTLDLDVAAYRELGLVVTDAGDGIGFDHADWADARFTYAGTPPQAVVAKKPGDLPEIEARPPDATVELFNGKDLDNWFADLPRGGTKDGVWAVRDGIIHCAGHPGGHLISDTAWKDYRLVVEWRWPPGGKGGNNGVLVHTSELHVLGNHFPRSIEVQLMSGNAGDFWVIGEDIAVPDMAKRREGRHIWNLNDGAEKPIGEWNRMEVRAEADTLKVWVNGRLVNEGFGCTASEGRITLQSEGAPCEFRRVAVMPLAAGE
jgi:hypothetical protein